MTFQHRAGVSPYTSSYDFAETCVCGKQLAEPLHCGPLSGAPLLPKLRGHFAEFLNEGSSDRLGILYLPTCVGFGTGTRNLPRRFSRRHGFKDFVHTDSASRLRLEGDGFPYHPPYAVTPGRPSPGFP